MTLLLESTLCSRKKESVVQEYHKEEDKKKDATYFYQCMSHIIKSVPRVLTHSFILVYKNIDMLIDMSIKSSIEYFVLKKNILYPIKK